jgi:cytochrome c-type biogenesis protein CcmF
LFLDAFTGTKISVGPPFFAITFAPIFVALLIGLPFGPRLSLHRAVFTEAVRPLLPALGAAMVAALVVCFVVESHVLAAAGAFALAAWVIAASLLDFLKRPVKTAAALAVAVAHAGLGVTLMGIAGTTLWRAETLVVLGAGETATVGPYTLTMGQLERADGPNYAAVRADINVSDGDRLVATLRPAKRIYPTEQQETAETAIRTTGFSDLYLALGDERGRGRFIVRAYYNPLAPFIWFGGAIMALGGMASLWGRVRARSAQPDAEAIPAE